MTQGKLRRRRSYAVWEITLKCNLACNHCGSRAGDARENELDTREALDLVQQMAQAGITEVTLIGGEAYLRKDWLEIAAEIVRYGMICTMTTGGYGISATLARRIKQAGMESVSVSLDGLEQSHNQQRGKADSWQQAINSMQHLREAGVSVTANSQVNRLSAPEFPMLYDTLLKSGISGWQIAMTVPMGNAADNSQMLLQPSELLVFHPVLAYLVRRGLQDGVIVQPGNNVGYYGPYEKLLRSYGRSSDWTFWRGCQAGMSVIGIEADGTIKGCPSLPTHAYAGGNIRDHSLRDIAMHADEMLFNMSAGTKQGTDQLWGFCKSCDYADLCRAGCSWTAHVFFDKRGNNPYCHHRALVHAAADSRESFKIKRTPFGLPFDNGEFEIYEEAMDAPWPLDEKTRLTPASIQWPQQWLNEDPDLQDYIQDEIDRSITDLRRYLDSRQQTATHYSRQTA